MLIYANAVGGQDGLIYDGGGLVFQNGRLVLDAPRFREGWCRRRSSISIARSRLRMENTTWRTDCEDFRLQRLDVPVLTCDGANRRSIAPRISRRRQARASSCPPAVPRASIRVTQRSTISSRRSRRRQSYFEKTGAFTSLGIALSGGRDSMLTLLVAWRAAAADRRARTPPAGLITAFYMPSRHSQASTRTAAHTLAEELGVAAAQPSRSTRPPTAKCRRRATCSSGGEPTELTRQNVQARLRGQRMWNWANSSGALFLQTGDMSEKAVGYTTMGGDLEGALSVIANVPKTVVIALLERLHRALSLRGHRAKRSPPSQGRSLPTQQVAEHELMPFPVLDACLHLYAGEKMSPDEVERRAGQPVSAGDPRAGARLGDALHEALLAVDLQVGAEPVVAPRRIARPRSRAGVADARRAENRMDAAAWTSSGRHRGHEGNEGGAKVGKVARAVKSARGKVAKFTARGTSKKSR